MMISNRLCYLLTGLCVIGQIAGCAQKIAKQDDFESSFLDYCRNERGPEQWHSLATYSDLSAKKEFLASQVRDSSKGYCQANAFILYAKVSSADDAATILRSVALRMDGQDVSSATQNITDEKLRTEIRFFLAEEHPSKWPLLTQLLESKQTKDLKSFERYVAIAKQRIKKGDFSAEDVQSLERRF